MFTQIKNAEELTELLAYTASTIVVRNALNELFLLMVSEDGDVGYQGFPMEDDEEATTVDPNTGWVESWPDAFWPLTYVGASDPDELLAVDESDPRVILAAVRQALALADGSDELQGEQNEWADVARVVIVRELIGGAK